MIARLTMVLGGVMAATGAYFIFFLDRNDMIFLLAAGLLVLVVAYVFQYQLEQISMRGTPQELDPGAREMLNRTAPHFSRLSEENRKMLEDRMIRWLAKTEFIFKSEPLPPADVRYLLAYYAGLLTLHQEKYQYSGLDRIAFYNHPFLSPNMDEDVHICEVELHDGTMILSAPHLLKGHYEKGYYNIALHTMAEAYAAIYMKKPIAWPDDIWAQLEKISTIPKIRLEEFLGFQLDDPWPVAVHHQVMYRGADIAQVLEVLPQLQIVQGDETAERERQ